MSRDNRVRGPNSALTEFLRSKNITVAALQERRERIQQQRLNEPQQEEQHQEVPAPAPSQRPTRSTRKRTSHSFDEDATENDYEPSEREESPAPTTSRFTRASKKSNKSNGFKMQTINAGQIAFCEECNCRFTVTPYTKPSANGEGLLCTPCTKKMDNEENPKIKKKAAARKTNKLKTQQAQTAMDKKKTGAPTLSETAINLICNNIDDCLAHPEWFSTLASHTMDKICQILSRNRRLNDQTFEFFIVNPDTDKLSLYDCAEIHEDKLQKIAAQLPLVQYLKLQYCAAMTDETIERYATQLPNLKGLELGGPYLVTPQAFGRFFELRGERLEELTLTDSYRINEDVFSAVADNCPNLRVLRLREIVRFDDNCLRLLTGLSSLKVLEIASPGGVITDLAVEAILNSIGSGLEELNLSGCVNLTDQTLQSIKACCPGLVSLNLSKLALLTDEGIAQLFNNWDINKGLQHLDLTRVNNLDCFGLEALLAHSGQCLESLSINSCYLKAETWNLWSQCGKLYRLKTLDISFIRTVTDTIAENLCEVAPNLEELRIWGIFGITEALNTPSNIRVVGKHAHLHT